MATGRAFGDDMNEKANEKDTGGTIEPAITEATSESLSEVVEEILAAQDVDKPMSPPFGEIEEVNPTEDVMGASPGNQASSAVEEAFMRGEVDVVEEMDRATYRMDRATGRSRLPDDPAAAS